MPLLLLIPLLLLGVVALWALLLPFAILQRYRHGTARRLAQPWVVKANAWLLAVSALLFLAGAWIGGRWIEAALPHAATGLLAGIALGLLGIRLGRFEATPRGLYHTQPRWLVFGITALVAGRIALGLWQGWRHWSPATEDPALSVAALIAGQATLLAVAGLLLGYYLGYTLGLRRRLGRRSR